MRKTTGPSTPSKIKIVTTFYPMYEFSKQIAGDHADVIALIPPGVEPHDWEPSPKDMALLKDADVFVYNGIVESWVDNALQSAANGKRIVVEASKGIVLLDERNENGVEKDNSEAGEGLDPHVWLSPALALHEVSQIEAAIEKSDPANREDYRKNARCLHG